MHGKACRCGWCVEEKPTGPLMVLEFNLGDPQERVEATRAVRATDYLLCLFAIEQWLRREYKDDLVTDEQWRAFADILDDHRVWEDMEEL